VIITVVVRFRIFGDVRYLSHSETIRVFQRALVRAKTDVAYSRGFNPRARISLPLPRSVGVEADDEIFCIKVNVNGEKFDTEQLLERLSLQMPEGIELLGANALTDKRAFTKGLVIYEYTLGAENDKEAIGLRIKDLLSQESLKINRQSGPKAKVKQVDVRGYLKSVEQAGNKIVVECRFGPDGTIRVDEIFSLLGFDIGRLAGPVKRAKVIWL